MTKEANMKIIPVFAKPLAMFEYDTPKELQNFLINQKQRENESHVHGGVSENVMLLREPELQDLRETILSAAAEFARELLGIDTYEMIDVCSWVSIKRPTQIHTPHIHPNSVISGVYFFDEHTNDMPLIFEDEIASVNSFILRPKILHDNNAPFPLFKSIPVDAKKNTIVMFPSFLKHGVIVNNSPFNRYSFAFNLLPKEGLGSEDTLTYFNYKDAI